MENINEASSSLDLKLPYKVRLGISHKPGLILLLHGVGSNENDLFALERKFPSSFTVVSARAPYTMSPGRYAWFQVDFSTGRPIINPEQAEASRLTLDRFVDQLIRYYGVDPYKVFIGGFSQGGIMSYSVGLTFPRKFKGILS